MASHERKEENKESEAEGQEDSDGDHLRTQEKGSRISRERNINE